ncbi:hypothetical protein [Jiella endophytica]|uniref:hypothetical protein n=1 Tax=Jiella endophytica TaxID=2558362 RepID=UPI00106FA5B3|nr:hypothetical protein [Jiella endophytica]
MVDRLLAQTPKTYAEEMGIDLARNSPMPLFLWLVAIVIFSAPISTALRLRSTEAELQRHIAGGQTCWPPLMWSSEPLT